MFGKESIFITFIKKVRHWTENWGYHITKINSV